MTPLPARLDDSMALAIGHAVAGFGALEHALKGAIHALSRERLGPSVGDAVLREWLLRMDNLADDSMGTLVDAFVAAMKSSDVPERHRLAADLRALRERRNLICHAAWQPGLRVGTWRPIFVGKGGEVPEADLSPADLRHLHDRTRAVIARVQSIATAAGSHSAEPGPEE